MLKPFGYLQCLRVGHHWSVDVEDRTFKTCDRCGRRQPRLVRRAPDDVMKRFMGRE
jgi:hypothetical protein